MCWLQMSRSGHDRLKKITLSSQQRGDKSSLFLQLRLSGQRQEGPGCNSGRSVTLASVKRESPWNEPPLPPPSVRSDAETILFYYATAEPPPAVNLPEADSSPARGANDSPR